MTPRTHHTHRVATQCAPTAGHTPTTGAQVRRGSSRGFTLIEIIAVLMITAILLSIASDKLFNFSTGELGAATAQLRNKIRYARTRAMNGDDIYGLRLISSTQYQVFRTRAGTTTNITLPGELTTMTLPQGVTVSGTGTTIIAFDQWGRPCSDLAGTTRRTANLTLTLSFQGQTETITVVRNTGYLQ